MTDPVSSPLPSDPESLPPDVDDQSPAVAGRRVTEDQWDLPPDDDSDAELPPATGCPYGCRVQHAGQRQLSPEECQVLCAERERLLMMNKLDQDLTARGPAANVSGSAYDSAVKSVHSVDWPLCGARMRFTHGRSDFVALPMPIAQHYHQGCFASMHICVMC